MIDEWCCKAHDAIDHAITVEVCESMAKLRPACFSCTVSAKGRYVVEVESVHSTGAVNRMRQ